MKTIATPKYEITENDTDGLVHVECHLAGVTYGQRQRWLAWLSRLEKANKKNDVSLVLRREKKNEFDANAIRVAAHGVKTNSYGFREFSNKYGDLGYLPAKLAAKIAPAMDEGRWVTIENWHTCGSARKGSSVGCVLTLSF